MRREIPLLLTFLFGTFYILSNFITWTPWKIGAESVNNWALIVIAFTQVLGVGNVLRIHGLKISRREPGWGYSVGTVAGLAVMVLFGIVLWFLPQTAGETRVRFRVLKDVALGDAILVGAPPGSGDLFDVRLATTLVLDRNADGSAGEGDEAEVVIQYIYSGFDPYPDPVFGIGFDGEALAPLGESGEPLPVSSALSNSDAGLAGTATDEEGSAANGGSRLPDVGAAAPHTQAEELPTVGAATRQAAEGGPSTVTAAPSAPPPSPHEKVAAPPSTSAAMTRTAAGLAWMPGTIQPSLFGKTLAGNGQQSLYNWFYEAIYVPMQSTMFSLLAFFISSAAFRAFRVRSLHAVLLGVAAILVILGSVPVGEAVWGGFPDLVAWIMNCLQTAGKRAILIGAALGAIATGLKMIVGTERSYLSAD